MFFFYFIFITCIKGIKKSNEFQSSSLIISSNGLPNYSPLDNLSFNELCYSLQATKFFFGINSLNSYSQCILSQQLIGLNASELKTEQPIFYLNLASVFCKYELKYSSNGFSEELSKLILGNIKACIQNPKNSDVKCPGLNFDSHLIEDPDLFCIRSERKEMIDNDISFRFIKKEQIYECKQILFVYNICTEGFNLLNNEETSDLCLNTKFRGYRGTKIKILNEEMIRKCENVILPNFAYYSLKGVTEDNNFCENYKENVKKTLNTKIEEIEENKKNETAKQKKLSDTLNFYENLYINEKQIVSLILKNEKLWGNCYSELQSFIDLKKIPNIQLLKNFDILIDVISDRIKISKSIFLSTKSPELKFATISDNSDLFYQNLVKINKTLENLEGVCEAIHNLIVQNQDSFLKIDEGNLDDNSKILEKFTNNILEDNYNKIIDCKSDFQEYLNFFQTKLLKEKSKLSFDLEKSKNDFIYYEKTRQNLIEQKQILSFYID